MKIMFRLLSCALVGILSLSATSLLAGPGPEQPPIHVEVTSVGRQDIAERLPAHGELIPAQSVELTSTQSGLVETVWVNPGDRVESGDPLIQLDDREWRADFYRAKAEYDYAKAELERQKTLQSTGAVRSVEREEKQLAYERAKAQLTLAEVHLEKAVIKAPFTGQIGFFELHPGTFITPGVPILSLVQAHPLRCAFSVPGHLHPRIEVGDAIIIQQDMRGHTALGTIDHIAPTLNEPSRQLPIQARLTNASEQFMPGEFVSVELVLSRHEQALVIPFQAVQMSDSPYVWRIDDEQAATKAPITLGHRDGQWVEVLHGLNENDTIVTIGSTKLYEGAIVEWASDES